MVKINYQVVVCGYTRFVNNENKIITFNNNILRNIAAISTAWTLNDLKHANIK